MSISATAVSMPLVSAEDRNLVLANGMGLVGRMAASAAILNCQVLGDAKSGVIFTSLAIDLLSRLWKQSIIRRLPLAQEHRVLRGAISPFAYAGLSLAASQSGMNSQAAMALGAISPAATAAVAGHRTLSGLAECFSQFRKQPLEALKAAVIHGFNLACEVESVARTFGITGSLDWDAQDRVLQSEKLESLQLLHHSLNPGLEAAVAQEELLQFKTRLQLQEQELSARSPVTDCTVREALKLVSQEAFEAAKGLRSREQGREAVSLFAESVRTKLDEKISIAYEKLVKPKVDTLDGERNIALSGMSLHSVFDSENTSLPFQRMEEHCSQMETFISNSVKGYCTDVAANLLGPFSEACKKQKDLLSSTMNRYMERGLDLKFKSLTEPLKAIRKAVGDTIQRYQTFAWQNYHRDAVDLRDAGEFEKRILASKQTILQGAAGKEWLSNDNQKTLNCLIAKAKGIYERVDEIASDGLEQLRKAYCNLKEDAGLLTGLLKRTFFAYNEWAGGAVFCEKDSFRETFYEEAPRARPQNGLQFNEALELLHLNRTKCCILPPKEFYAKVRRAKREILKQKGCHPDTGGSTDAAAQINIAGEFLSLDDSYENHC